MCSGKSRRREASAGDFCLIALVEGSLPSCRFASCIGLTEVTIDSWSEGKRVTALAIDSACRPTREHGFSFQPQVQETRHLTTAQCGCSCLARRLEACGRRLTTRESLGTARSFSQRHRLSMRPAQRNVPGGTLTSSLGN